MLRSDDRTTARPAGDDPASAEWRWLETRLKGNPVPPVLAVIGLGRGYLLDALDRFAPGTRVLALEPDPASITAFRARRTGDEWRASGRLVYLTGPEFDGADQAWRLFPTGVASAPVLVGSTHVHTDRDVRAARVLKNILFGVKANDEARQRFAPRYLVNSLRNIPRIIGGYDVRTLTNAYRGVPAIVAGAGPSLDTVLGDLRAAGDRAVIIAADTALRPLLLHGIVPQVVVALDPSPVNARHLLSLPECPETWLVSESALDPEATAAFAGRTFWFHASNHHPWPWFNELGIDAGELSVWGSVLTGAFEMACLAGCDPIVMVGADLSYTNDRPYARGTTYEIDWAHHVAIGHVLEDMWRGYRIVPEAHREPDVRGIEATTTKWLLSFRDWMCARAKNSGRRVINATGAGMLFADGLEQAALLKVLRQTYAIPPVSSFARRAREVQPAVVADRLRALRRQLDAEGPRAHPLSQWAEFSGRGFTPASIGEALDEAAHRLETTDAPGTSGASHLGFAPSDTINRIFPYLPEAMARFRLALDNTEPLPALAAVSGLPDAIALLTQARNLFDQVCDGIATRQDVAGPHEGVVPVGTHVSQHFTWPVPLRHTVEMFEAVLGVAWPPARSTAPKSESPFFSRPQSIRDYTPNGHTRAAAMRACSLLALQWWHCAENLDPAIVTGASDVTLNVPIDGGEALLTRKLTGTIPGPSPSAPRVLIGLRDDRYRPIVLTDGVSSDRAPKRAVIGYATSRGVVCLTPHTRDRFLVSPNGSIESLPAWPRTIVDEVPFGDDGAIAWSNGLANWPESAEPAYVMYRREANGAVTIEELPIRPTIGTWWNGRLYWNCYPAPIPTWTGVASWAPGETPRLEIPNLTVFGVMPDEDGLLLDPCIFHPQLGWEHRSYAHAWRWKPGQPLTAVPHGCAGPCSARATSHGWTALAHPDADLVRFESTDGHRVSMICYYPLRLAWIGRSLLVSTAERELLLFDRLLDRLHRFQTSARP